MLSKTNQVQELFLNSGKMLNDLGDYETCVNSKDKSGNKYAHYALTFIEVKHFYGAEDFNISLGLCVPI